MSLNKSALNADSFVVEFIDVFKILLSLIKISNIIVTTRVIISMLHLTSSFAKMSEKLCLQWNDFKENVSSSFGKLRTDKEFTNVTLGCEDGQQMEAHKVIWAYSSPFFEKVFQKSKHHHPLIFLRGFRSNDFASILDFLYYGEANVYQEDLDSFLTIAEEIELKGLTVQTFSDVLEEQEKPNYTEPATRSETIVMTSSASKRDLPLHGKAPIKPSTAVAIPNQTYTDLQILDEKVKSMMEKGHRMLPNGAKDRNGTPRQQTSSICKVCGKEGLSKNLRFHIETNHLEGISIPCDYCHEIFSSRSCLVKHKSRTHK